MPPLCFLQSCVAANLVKMCLAAVDTATLESPHTLWLGFWFCCCRPGMYLYSLNEVIISDKTPSSQTPRVSFCGCMYFSATALNCTITF